MELFDTSILVAAFVEAHSMHRTAFELLKKQQGKKQGFAVAAHSLAEIYSVLTRLPMVPKISPIFVTNYLQQQILPWAKIITLSTNEYFSAIKYAQELNLVGGIIYDVLVYWAAKKAKVKNIVTFNKKDFIRFCEDNQSYIKTP